MMIFFLFFFADKISAVSVRNFYLHLAGFNFKSQILKLQNFKIIFSVIDLFDKWLYNKKSRRVTIEWKTFTSMLGWLNKTLLLFCEETASDAKIYKI